MYSGAVGLWLEWDDGMCHHHHRHDGIRSSGQPGRTHAAAQEALVAGSKRTCCRYRVIGGRWSF